MTKEYEEKDRRRHIRISLKAFGLDHRCTLQHGRTVHPALIVDISSGGARLRLENGTGSLAKGDICLVDTLFKGIPPEDARRESTLRWLNGTECGLAFLTELPFGTTDLQRLLDS